MSSSLHVKEWRKRTKQRIVDAFKAKCTICSYDKCNDALDLHHIDPDKKNFSFNRIRANPKNWAEIVNELRKCVLLCANCHREVHAGLVKIPDDYIKFDEDFADYKNIALMDKTNSLVNKCPICNNDKPVWQQTCSKKCSIRLKGRYNWDMFDLTDLYVNQKLSLNEIARKIGCTGMAVSKRLVSLNIPLNTSVKRIIWPDNSTLEKLVKEISLDKIRKQIGCSHTGLRKHLRKNNIPWEKQGVWQKRYALE